MTLRLRGAGRCSSLWPEHVFTCVSLSVWNPLQPKLIKQPKHRQGWFTYSYCHNEEIRQFKEASQTQPNTAGNPISRL